MSPSGWLRRLGRMDREELVFRARIAARQKAARLAGAWRAPRWERQDLAARLARSAGPLDTALERLEARDWAGAHKALADHFHRRVSGFPISPHALPQLADRIRQRFPHAAHAAAARADRIAAGRFDLLGYRDLSFATSGAPIDWHYDPVHDRRAPRAWWSQVRYLDPASGDHKIIWELNRHQHFLALGRAAWLTGESRYRDVFVEQLEAWLRSNPPLVGINWASMLELALRSLSWVWSLHFFVEFVEPPGARPDPRPGAPWIVDLLLALDRQLDLVEANLSRYFSPNTHLTGEALGLYVCGRALPELLSAARWADTGRAVLLEQIERQVMPDGGHVERAALYHRYTLDFYLLALVIARATDDPCADRFAEAVDRLAWAARVLSDADGRLPLIGDEDGGSLFPICGRGAADARDSLASAAAVLGRADLAGDDAPEETMWLLGSQPEWGILRKREGASRRADPARSAALPDTGFFVSRRCPGDHIVIDAGPHGFLNGGHAHADALSLAATLAGLPLTIDPGTATYTMSPGQRDRFRSSQMHNTLTLDGRSQSIPGGPFHWKTVAHARVARWFAGESFDYFEGVHDGYLPVVHRRRVLADASGRVLVVDTVLGDLGSHVAEVHWHLDPEWHVEAVEQGGISLRRPTGEHAWFATLGGSIEFLVAEPEGLGWCSPAYGRVEPTTTLRLRAEGTSPLAIVTAFGAGGRRPVPRLHRVPAEAGVEGADAVAVEVDADDSSDLFVFGYRRPVLPERPPAEARPAVCLAGDDSEGRVVAAGLDTDARVLWQRRDRSSGSVRMAMLDGRYVRDVRNGEVIVSAPAGREDAAREDEQGARPVFHSS